MTGLDARIARHALVERAEERDAAVGVVFPAVLAVEDDRDERRRVVPAGVADGVQLAQEVGRGDRPGTALVVEPDLVRHRMVAEDDRQLRFALAHLPGAVEQLGMADVAPAVAADLAAGRAAQDLLVGGDPLDAVPGQQRDQGLADRALAGPHAPWRRSEAPQVAFDGAADVDLGVLGITVAIGWQGHVGHRLARELLVQQQGEDRVVVGRRGQLDLAALGQLRCRGMTWASSSRCLSSSHCFSSSV